MRYLTLAQVERLHRLALEQAGGSDGVRDRGGLESAVAQPTASFGGEDLYPTLVEKAAAMGFSLVMNHPFIDGNKRVGYLAMEAMLAINGHEIHAPIDEAERVILAVAAGQAKREQLIDWLRQRVVKSSDER